MMSTVDIDALLQEVEPAAPCGPNLEYDPAFVELEQAVLGKSEVQYGTTITAAVPPEWKLVKRLATDLLGRSRDLRLAVHLLRANLSLYGIAGLADSLALIERLLDERWDSVHPELDADDDMDSTLRVNSLAVMADSTTVLKDLKEVTLVVLPGLGPLTLRTLDIASGELTPPKGQEKLALSSIEAALGDIDDAILAMATSDIRRAHNSAIHIETILVHRVGSAQTINLDGLTRALKRGRDFLMAHLEGRKGVVAQEALMDEPVMPDQQTHQGASVNMGAPPISNSLISEITNRADVVREIDKILKYYEQYEPSSPIPTMLGRVKWLVSKNFLQIMEELAPDALAGMVALKGNCSETPIES